MPATPAPPHPRTSALRRRLLAGVLALAAGISLAVVPTLPASAASIGPGWTPQENDGLGFLGAFAIEGRLLYCLDPVMPEPLGATSGPVLGGWGSATPDDLARVSWAIAGIGQSPDRRDAGAVALYVWSVLAPGIYHSRPLPGDEWYARRVPDPDDRAEVLARLAWIRAQTAGIGAVPGSGSGALTISIDPTDEYRGTVSVTGIVPPGAVGTIVLSNGVFDATGTPSAAGVRDGSTLDVTGVPPNGAEPYRIGAEASFVVPGAWVGEIALWSTPGAQTLAGPGRTLDLVFPLQGGDVRDRSVLFQPVVTTLAEPRVLPGSRYRDVLRFALAPDSGGRVNRWYRNPDGGYLPVTASCRIFGPFAERPAPAAEPPVGAPLASSFVVTTGRDGPDVDYSVDSEQHLTRPGWYTTQCSIDAGSQPAASRPFLPAGYRFEDPFGIPEETAVVPFLPELSTTFVERIARPGERVVDAVTVGISEGPWVLDEQGAPIPIVIEGRFTAVVARPEQSAFAPADAEEVAVQRITVAGPGRYEAEPVPAPAGADWLVAQWCVLESEHVRPVCDDWGEFSETVAILSPEVPEPRPPTLAVTGRDGRSVAAGSGIALILLGGGALLGLLHRRPRPARRPR